MSELHELIFPPFRLDMMHGRLCRDAECIPIRLKTLAVLRDLIEYRQRVVSRAVLVSGLARSTAIQATHRAQEAPGRLSADQAMD